MMELCRVWQPLLFAACLAVSQAAAGDLMDKIRQFSDGSKRFQTPCVFYFDLSYLVEREDSTAISTMRLVGRQIVGKDGKFRLDFMKETKSDRADRVTWEHYYEIPLVEKQYCFRLGGGQLQRLKIDTKDMGSLKPPIARIDPYCYAVGGGRERNHQPMGSVDIILRNFTDLSGDFLRNKDNVATGAVRFSFDADNPVRILQCRALTSSKTCSEENAVSWDKVSLKTITDQWFESKLVGCKWSTIDDFDVPVAVQSIDRFFNCKDPTAIEEFNGRFFDYDFNAVDESIYFNSSRLTDEHLSNDFPYKRILQRASEVDK